MNDHIEWRFPRHPRSVGRARTLLAEQAREIRARFAVRDGLLRIEVSDACAALPHPRHVSPDDETGRGLALVEALAERWGAEPRPCGIGKTVWFEIATAARPAPVEVTPVVSSPPHWAASGPRRPVE
ncbi:ATP-binding protein [Streptomyces sp. NPDC002994]|uniref:ATP-binding protein n=1 Tax=Streptomyces sp. NPDC002994 TaxID=3154441 RepID=UPI0033AA501A